VQPDEAVFGIKDYQQLAVIKRMTEDLCLPVKIIPAPIHREADGLAMSSRNSYINEDERPKVKVLKEVLESIAQQLVAGNLAFTKLENEAKKRIELEGFKVDYVTICNSKTLQAAAVDDRQITILGALYTESARLIDNISIILD
jgi:pantoate--beta-alanine ligase